MSSYEHLWLQYTLIRVYRLEVKCIRGETGKSLLYSYKISGKTNNFKLPILRDTGSTVDVVCHKYIDRDRMTGQHIWVQHMFDDHLRFLPVSPIDVKSDFSN